MYFETAQKCYHLHRAGKALMERVYVSFFSAKIRKKNESFVISKILSIFAKIKTKIAYEKIMC